VNALFDGRFIEIVRGEVMEAPPQANSPTRKRNIAVLGGPKALHIVSSEGHSLQSAAPAIRDAENRMRIIRYFSSHGKPRAEQRQGR
jgi:hypothetical protein